MRHNSPTPFTGPVDHHFDALLGQAGIFRRQCRIMNVMPTCEPMWLDKKMTKPTKELEAGIQTMYAELAKLSELQVIVALGRDPMYILTRMQQDGISKWAGSISIIEIPSYSAEGVGLSLRPVKMVPTFHPSFALKQWTINPLIVHNLKRAKGEVDNLEEVPKRILDPNPTTRTIQAFFTAWRNTANPLAVDIECASGMITRISFAYTPYYALSIPFRDDDTGSIIPDRDWIIDLIRDVLKTAPVVGQNFGIFDRYWLKHKWNVDCDNIVGDTMIAQHVILPGLPESQKPLSLAMLTRLYTKKTFYKDTSKNDPGIYSCLDSAITYEVYNKQIATSQFKRRKDIYNLEMKLVTGPIWYMMQRGVLFDRAEQRRLRLRYKDEMEWLELSINQLAGSAINIRSPKQIAKLLYDDTGLKGPSNRSTNSEEVFILKARYPNEPILNYLSQYRKIDKIYTTVLAMEVDKDSRFRCSYSPTTTTGRLKSFENPFGMGCNGVHMDKDPNIRPLFSADPGYYLVEADLEQAELRAVAYYANDQHLIKLLEDKNIDIHSWMASKILDREVTKANVAERQLGKRVVRAGNYLISARDLVRTCRIELGIDMKETQARNLLKMYFTAFPAIKRWHKQIERQLQQNNNVLTTALGRERKFFERWGIELFRKATAFLPQSTIADLLNTIMLEWFDTYNDWTRVSGDEYIYTGKLQGSELLMQLYDAFYTQCPKDNIGPHIITLKEVFNHPITINRHTVTIPVGIKVTKYWGGEEVRFLPYTWMSNSKGDTR